MGLIGNSILEYITNSIMVLFVELFRARSGEISELSRLGGEF